MKQPPIQNKTFTESFINHYFPTSLSTSQILRSSGTKQNDIYGILWDGKVKNNEALFHNISADIGYQGSTQNGGYVESMGDKSTVFFRDPTIFTTRERVGRPSIFFQIGKSVFYTEDVPQPIVEFFTYDDPFSLYSERIDIINVRLQNPSIRNLTCL